MKSETDGEALVVVSAPVTVPDASASSMTDPEIVSELMRVRRPRVVEPVAPLRSVIVAGWESFS